MEETQAAVELLSGQLSNITNILAAISALGLAAFGLVDVTKVFGGGASRVGFGFIRSALQPFVDRIQEAKGRPSNDPNELIMATLWANWINGVAKDTQKATARSLINLNLNGTSAPALAALAGVGADALKSAAEALNSGNDLSEQQINTLGRFNTIVNATLDMAYEQADQHYRNASKSLAAGFAVLLSCTAGGIIFVDGSGSLAAYFRSADFLLAILIGAVSTPVAPIAKDISTSLTAAVGAMAKVKR